MNGLISPDLIKLAMLAFFGASVLLAILDLFAEESIGTKYVLFFVVIPLSVVWPEYTADGVFSRQHNPIAFWSCLALKLAMGLAGLNWMLNRY